MRKRSSQKRVLRWFTKNKRGIVEQIAVVFAFITVVNSPMMVVGWDQPKAGSFAYLHLLGRLGIITLIVVLVSIGIVVF